jgi:hypothetical protein
MSALFEEDDLNSWLDDPKRCRFKAKRGEAMKATTMNPARVPQDALKKDPRNPEGKKPRSNDLFFRRVGERLKPPV